MITETVWCKLDRARWELREALNALEDDPDLTADDKSDVQILEAVYGEFSVTVDRLLAGMTRAAE